jgi:hypothetical protein
VRVGGVDRGGISGQQLLFVQQAGESDAAESSGGGSQKSAAIQKTACGMGVRLKIRGAHDNQLSTSGSYLVKFV